MLVVGARPQFVKVAPLVRAINRYVCGTGSKKKQINQTLIHTGQHYDIQMSRIFFDELQIPLPDLNLGIGSLSHGAMTGRMLEKLESTMTENRPDLVIVFGDTNSTLAGVLAAVKLGIPSAHIEAGLRSYRKDMPEEINRVLTDYISDYLFCPTTASVENLKKEGRTEGVFQVGDIMYDTFLFNSKLVAERKDILTDMGVERDRYFLATIHRQENTDHEGRLREIISTLGDLPYQVILPLHPRTQKHMVEFNIKPGSRIIQVSPVPYLDMLGLMVHSAGVLTDSGGLQKEACMSGVPCITLRDETEWVETVNAGWNFIAGTEKTVIIEAVNRIITKQWKIPTSDSINQIYGKGDAAEKIVNILVSGS